MKSNTQLGITRLTTLSGLVFWSLTTFATDKRVELTREVATETTHAADLGQRDYTPKYLADRLGVVERSTHLTGLSVRDVGGHKLGKLEDVLVDLGSGKILSVQVADSAGVVPVPARCFRSPDANGAMIDMDKPSLADAPHAPESSGAGALLASVRSSFSYFNRTPVWASGATPIVSTSTELIGVAVKNPKGDALGKVVDLMEDLPTARVVFVVVSFKGGNDDLYLVPPMAFDPVPGGRTLVLNADKAKITALAHSDGFFWSNVADPATGIAAYQNFGVKADFDDSASATTDSNREQVRAKVDTAPVPQKGDAEIQHDILTAMMHDDVNNALTFKNVRMKASNGVVTLTGRVKNDKQKAKLDAIVASVVGAANIRDQLEVK